MVLDLIIDIGTVLMLLAAVVLCVTGTVVLVKLLPPLLRSAQNLEKISTDAAAVSGDITLDISKTARNAAAASENAIEASGNLRKISNDIASISGDVAQDTAKTARNAATASENTVEATECIVNAAGDFAEAAANVVAISRLDVRAILTQIASGNINNVKDLAGFAGRNIPRAVSRVGSFFRRGGD